MKHINFSKHALIVVLLWAFAPLAWYLIWKDKKYHSWFPKLLWVNGLIFGFLFLTQSFIFIPKFIEIYDALDIHLPPYIHPLAVLLVLVFAGLQVYAGFDLQKRVRKDRKLVERYLAPILIIFAIDGLLAFSTGVVSAIQSPSALIEKMIIPQVHQLTVNKESPSALPPLPTPKPTITPTPSPKPLSFAQMNTMYGPCVHMPTLMYHHIGNLSEARKLGRQGLTVSPENLDLNINYLLTKNYSVKSMKDLSDFFTAGTPVSGKPVLITFDDGYDDFYTNAYPLLRKYNVHATMFLPTGLVGNAGYLTWGQINEMNSSGLVFFANHTWSHHPMNKIEANTLDQEINEPDKMLLDHNLGNPKIFAYPYGTEGDLAKDRLTSLGYKAAFTTKYGTNLCKKLALTLPRVRVGNEPLSKYGI